MLDGLHLWWINNIMLIYIFSIFCSSSLQARWCDAEAHPWWDCSLALLPLACGDFPGWSPHCGPDHLCQELGCQGRGNKKEEAFVSGKAAHGKEKPAGRSQVGQPDPSVGAPGCASFQSLIHGGVALVSGLFLGDCPMKCQLIASSAMALNKYILPKKGENLHCTKYAVCCYCWRAATQKLFIKVYKTPWWCYFHLHKVIFVNV